MRYIITLLMITILNVVTSCDSPAYQGYDRTAEITDEVQFTESKPEPLDAETKAKLEKTVKEISSRVTIAYDDMENGTSYYPKIRPDLINSNYIGISEYVDNNNEPFIGLEINHENNVEDGIALYNMQSYIIKADGRTFRIDATEGMSTSKDHYGFEYEWYNGSIGDKEMEMLESIAESKEAKIRCQGETHNLERTITKKEKDAIRDMIDLYSAHLVLNGW